MEHLKKDCFKKGHCLGIFFVLLFALCMVWYYVHPVEQALHVRMLKVSFFRFTGMNAMSFISGGVQSYLWGHIGLAVWCLACRLGCLGFRK